MSERIGSIRKTVVELYETQRGIVVRKYHKERSKIESQMQKRIAEILSIEDVGKVNAYVFSDRLTIELSFSTLVTKEFICNITDEVMPYVEQLNKLYVDYTSDMRRLNEWYSKTLKALIEDKELPSFPELMLEER